MEGEERQLLSQIATDVVVAKEQLHHIRHDDLPAIRAHQERTNGELAAANERGLRLEGAIDATRWFMALILALVSAGAAVGGVVLTVVIIVLG